MFVMPLFLIYHVNVVLQMVAVLRYYMILPKYFNVRSNTAPRRAYFNYVSTGTNVAIVLGFVPTFLYHSVARHNYCHPVRF